MKNAANNHGYIEQKDRHFFNCLDVGFAAEVAKRANKTLRELRQLKYLPNAYTPHISYIKAAFSSVFSYRAQKFSVILDDKIRIAQNENCLMIGALNGKREGKIFTAAPDASLEDGLLNVNLIRNIPTRKRVHCLLKARNGKQKFLNYVTYKTASEIHIKSDRKFPIQADGEELEPENELTLSVKPKKLKIAKI